MCYIESYANVLDLFVFTRLTCLSCDRDLTSLTRLSLAALQENPCTDIQLQSQTSSSTDPQQGGKGASWLMDHVLKLKYQARVDKMNALAQARG